MNTSDYGYDEFPDDVKEFVDRETWITTQEDIRGIVRYRPVEDANQPPRRVTERQDAWFPLILMGWLLLLMVLFVLFGG